MAKTRVHRRLPPLPVTKPIDPLKRLHVAVALAPAFAEEYFRGDKKRWRTFDDLADTLLNLATAITKKL
jgi:hypothetical protein